MPYDNIVKGFELTKDRYVVITPEELEALDPEKTRTIDIEDFVDLEDIDPIFYDHPYYLVPDKGAAKAYGLLLEAMRESGQGRDRPRRHPLEGAARRDPPRGRRRADDGDDDLRRRGRRPPTSSTTCRRRTTLKTSDRELKMAQQLIDSLSSDFEPAKYHDEYREKVLELIERKAAGEEIAVQPAGGGAGRRCPT